MAAIFARFTILAALLAVTGCATRSHRRSIAQDAATLDADRRSAGDAGCVADTALACDVSDASTVDVGAGGTVDAGCTSGTTRPCGVDAGMCKVGNEVCVAGSWTGCSVETGIEETCDGRDNNCNGVIDDGATCASRPNAIESCSSGACNHTCLPSYGDCDAATDNGCEAMLLTDAWNCGACGNICASALCASGVCVAGGGASWCSTDACEVSQIGSPPGGRANHTAIWTGSEMIVWGGGEYERAPGVLVGARYSPTTDAWANLSTEDAPSDRAYHTAVWTGTEMIVWGGYYDRPLNNGARYNPTTDTWTALPTTGAPATRSEHTAVWTGSEMIVWGGWATDRHLGTGARYNPARDEWTALPTTGAPLPRSAHTAVWTGSEMIIWGGEQLRRDRVNTGARYRVASDSWIPMTTPGFYGRKRHSAVWSGSEMIVWGGEDASFAWSDGGRYDPEGDSWNLIETAEAPVGRSKHSGIWTGSELIVWGGFDGVNVENLNTGSRFTVETDTWSPLPTPTVSARENHTAVWTGAEMIVWGGRVNSGVPLGDGWIWRP